MLEDGDPDTDILNGQAAEVMQFREDGRSEDERRAILHSEVFLVTSLLCLMHSL